MTNPLAQPDTWDSVADAYAAELTTQFEHFARRALTLAMTYDEKLYQMGAVIDVAAGAGALSRVANEYGHRATAIDFSPRMIEALKARAPGVKALVGDGMALPFEDHFFDAGFSMFGLMFFPDRKKGFAELFRVLEPGGPAVVGSWHALGKVPILSAMMKALTELLPPPPNTPPYRPALVSHEDCIAEMSAAGFQDVTVQDVDYVVEFPSVEHWWAHTQRTNAAVALRRQSLGTGFGWAEISAQLPTRLRQTFGLGAQTITLTANLTVGRRPR